MLQLFFYVVYCTMKKNNSRRLNFWYFFTQQKWSFLAYIILLAAASGLSVLAIFYTAQFIDAISQSPRNFDAAVTYVLKSAITVVGTYVLYIVAYNLFVVSTQNMARNIRRTLADRTFMLKSKTFAENSTGIFISRITRDPNESVDALDRLLDAFSHIITFAITVIYICFLNVWLALMLLGSIVIMSLFEWVRVRLRVKHSTIQKKIQDQNTSLTNEIVRSERDIKSLDLEDKMRDLAYESYSQVRRAHMRTHMTGVSLWCVRNMLVAAITAVILYVGIVMLKQGALTIAALMFVLVNKDSLNSLIWNIGHIAESFADIRVASKRMFEIFDDEKFPTETFGKNSIESPHGSIEFKNVTFIYNDIPIRQDSDKPAKPSKRTKNKAPEVTENNTSKDITVLDNVSFKISAGTTVAFVGKSGSGKSTILNLISKLYDPGNGQIFIDGKDIKTLSRDSIRQNISLVNQFPYIFDASIRENLLMTRKDATDEELRDALHRASLAKFVDSLSHGIDTRVGESGIKLSGGQRQRLAIARALLKKSKIILFDESTSSLDNQTQEEIKQSIAALMGGHTVVIVAHRLSTIKNCDKIFFIENGHIKGEGTYDELRKNNKDFEKFFTLEEF